MRRAIAAGSALAVAAVLPFVATTPADAAQPRLPGAPDSVAGKKLDNRTNPFASQRTALRQQAVDALVGGDAHLKGRGRSRTIELASGAEVDYPATQHAKLLTFLVEFGTSDPADLADPDFPADGPLHNEIPEPGPEDNTTYWKSTFERQHYLDMFFNGMPEQGGESFRDLYTEMSSGRFDLTGDVSDWVQVPEAEAYYSDAGGYENQPEMTAFIGDAADAWAEAAATGGQSLDDVQDYLSQYDIWDRYDLDGDGDYNEPDGYIDHFQAVHAGEGEEAGADIWTIWSHRWAANIAGVGADGPVCPGDMDVADPTTDCRIGGVEIGDTGFYIYDYTTEPENGGLGVFAHEFAHDLGLPDYYDTNDGDNSNGFWTLMDSGSWLGHGDGATGNSAGHMGATEKLFLGWYGAETEDGFDDLAIVDGTGAPEEVVLGPSYHATETGKQAVLVTLPDGSGTADGPVPGDYLYSGTRDGTTVTAVSGPLAVPEASPTLSAHVQYAIENGYDFAFLDVSVDDGATWTVLPTNLSVDGGGLTGTQATTAELTADLTPWAGQQVRLRWRYVTDGNTHGPGLIVHDLTVGDYTTSYAAEDEPWTLSGFFNALDGSYDYDFAQSYIAENRSFDGYDVALAQGPYSHDYAVSAPGRKVDHYSYEDGLLLYYSNGAYGDNNTSEHPGYGANLPVDSRPFLMTWTGTGPDAVANGRLQTFDATFDVDDTQPLSLTREVPGGTQSVSVGALPSVPVFEDNDSDGYWTEAAGGWFSTKVAGVGTTIQVVSSDEESGRMVVRAGRNFVAPVREPVITGDAVYGGELTLDPGWFQDGVDTEVTWLRDGVAIEGAPTGTTYEPVAADVGHEITAAAVGSKPGWDEAQTEVAEGDGVTVAAAEAPEPDEPLAIDGTARVGEELSADGATWPVEGDSAFTWLVDDVEVGTGTTYTVKAGDLGEQITLQEVFSADGYEDATTTATTAAVGTGAAATTTAPLRIGGTARVGGTLTAQGADWSRAGTSSFVWKIGATQVGTGTSYDVKPGDLGEVITLVETHTVAGHEDATTSASTPAIGKGTAATTTAPLAIGGSASVGSTLTAQGAGWSRAGTSTFAWTVGGTPTGTGTTYEVKPGDVGKVVRLTETRSTTGYEDATTSVTTAAVTPGAAPTATAPPRIAGPARAGATLTVSGASWSRGGTSTFTWSIGGTQVGSGASYAVKVGDVGKIVTVTETLTASGYNPGAATASTGTVAKAPVTLDLTVGKAKKGKKVSLKVTADSPDLPVTGKVKVTYGGESIGTFNLSAEKVTLKLPKRGKGTYTLKVAYLPAAGFATTNASTKVRVR